MANHKLLFIFVLIIVINCIRCEWKHPIHRVVEAFNNKSRQMYGDPRGTDLKNVQLQALTYPRGDKRKLSELSALWREYYLCTARQVQAVTTVHLLPGVLLSVYQGAVARLPCSACDGPGETLKLTWMYAQSTDLDNQSEVEENDRLSIEGGNMTIYNVMPEDSGVYWCQIGDTGGGLVILEVVDAEEPYTVVKPGTSQGPQSIAPEVYSGLQLLSLWSRWSECSACDKVGRRHRYGLCYVKLDENLVLRYLTRPDGTGFRTKLFELDDKLMELFEAFPAGVPCRSQYLPSNLRRLDVLQQRPSEIMIGMCKVLCKDERPTTDLQENITQDWEDTNGTFIYSLTQVLPRQPPLPARNTIFVELGQQIAIRCPGTTLRDVPLLWRVGTRQLVPRDVDKGSSGRVHLNSRDHLVFTTVLYQDDNLYSCWQRENLAGSVRLVVWAEGGHHAALLSAVLLAALLLLLAQRAARAAPPPHHLLYHLY